MKKAACFIVGVFLLHGSPSCFANHLIRFSKDSLFLKRLVPYQISNASQLSSYPLTDVGQIIAVESFGIEMRNKKTWNELDPQLTRRLGLNLGKLSEMSADRTALGVAYLPRAAVTQFQREMPISVSRYGLKQFQSKARILSLISHGKETAEIIFQISDGQSWIPGATCEIEFHTVKRKPVRIPIAALIYIGAEEYVVRVLDPGVYEAKHVSVLEMNREFAVVDGDINLGDFIVNEGAILLKLEVQQSLKIPSSVKSGDG